MSDLARRLHDFEKAVTYRDEIISGLRSDYSQLVAVNERYEDLLKPFAEEASRIPDHIEDGEIWTTYAGHLRAARDALK